jgi:hypothetical protein
MSLLKMLINRFLNIWCIVSLVLFLLSEAAPDIPQSSLSLGKPDHNSIMAPKASKVSKPPPKATPKSLEPPKECMSNTKPPKPKVYRNSS